MFNIERWKTIKGFPRYKISSMGRVKSYWMDKNGKILAWKYAGQQRNKKPMINLRLNMKTHNIMIHKLVANAFIRNPKPEIYNCVSFKDGNCMNVLPSNLYWTNKKELAKKAFKKWNKINPVNYRWAKWHKWHGGVSERFKELVLKTSAERLTGSNPVSSGDLIIN